jgi:hypothetical protein
MKKAKSIPCSVYMLPVINFIMLVGFVYQENTVVYMIGEFIIAIAIVTAVGHLTGCFTVPKELVSQKVQERCKHI